MGILQNLFKRNPKTKPSLTIASLEAMTDDERVEAVAMYLQHQVRSERDLKDLSPALRMIHTSWYLEAEVNNGGYSQYFLNTANVMKDVIIYHAMTLDGLRLLELSDAEDNFEKAWEIYRQQFALEERGKLDDKADETMEARWNELDEQFYGLEANLITVREAYCREHLQEFIID